MTKDKRKVSHFDRVILRGYGEMISNPPTYPCGWAARPISIFESFQPAGSRLIFQVQAASTWRASVRSKA